MKKIIYIAGILLCLFLMAACKKALKNVSDYYPKVTTQAATVNADGTVNVSATIESTGQGALDFIGFCMDTLPVPNMMSNQKIVTEISGSTYSVAYTMNFDANKTYYFRSWASNSNGYTYGNVVVLKNIKAVPVVAPCSYNLNTSSIGMNGSSFSQVYQVSAVDGFSSTWNITTSGYDANAGDLRFAFGSEPKTKVYTTTEGNPLSDQVYISITSGFSSGHVLAGSKVYVNKQASGVYEINVCSAPWKLDDYNITYTLKARFVSPYQ